MVGGNHGLQQREDAIGRIRELSVPLGCFQGAYRITPLRDVGKGDDDVFDAIVSDTALSRPASRCLDSLSDCVVSEPAHGELTSVMVLAYRGPNGPLSSDVQAIGRNGCIVVPGMAIVGAHLGASHMRSTHNTLSENIRAQSGQLLNKHLAAAIDLHTQVKQAHWNVRGPGFIAIHELFDGVSNEVENYSDLIAERAGGLGPRHPVPCK